ncbi:putative acetyltransferase (GNAT) [Lyophyllum shimeji]|uniref:Acetyltransferase (GNAT) n=1 Tax=Lyophyllum shimeji TaxID=47721 RepID=A0A9P3UHI6_LYOSH|nr:putative acetyltransferase (GNAT) [Lyophyllum shimeji]
MAGNADVPAHEIVIARTEQEVLQCYDVRIAVFHVEQNFPLETEIDEFDPTATHFLLRLTPSLTPVGTIRGYKAPGGYYKLSRLAVLKDYRSFRFGRELVLALHDWVKADALSAGGDNKFVEIVSHSQLYVKGFYAKFGYQPEGAEFDEDGDPHQKMVLRLPL